MVDDEIVEVTPKTLRLRKAILCKHERKKMKKAESRFEFDFVPDNRSSRSFAPKWK